MKGFGTTKQAVLGRVASDSSRPKHLRSIVRWVRMIVSATLLSIVAIRFNLDSITDWSRYLMDTGRVLSRPMFLESYDWLLFSSWRRVKPFRRNVRKSKW